MVKLGFLSTLCLLIWLGTFVNTIKIPERQADPLPWWEEGIIYQIYPRSHQDSDGDGIGDLAGIESRMDHFVDLGITTVWLSPIYKSPMKDFGYDISDFRDIEPVFGNMTTFKSLSDALKSRGIKLVMDFVPNHSSDEHEWFKLSVQKVDPYTDYYIWKDPKGFDSEGKPIPPNNWRGGLLYAIANAEFGMISVFGGPAWEWKEERQQFYYHHFVIGQPDLNYENPVILNEMLAATKFWMDNGVDGFRMDAVPHLFEAQHYEDEPEDPNRPPEALPEEYRYWLHPNTRDLPAAFDAFAEFRRLIDVYSLADGIPRCMMVEATINDLDLLFKWYGDDSKPIAHFPFNFLFITKVQPDFNASTLIGIVDEWFTKMPEGGIANWLVGNHDNHRVASRFGDYATDPFNMIIHLLPGSSVMYYGEEIGMVDTEISWEDTVDPAGCNAGPDRYQLLSRDPERTPMQWNAEKNSGFSTGDKTWLPMNPNYAELNVEIQRGVEGSHLETFKKIALLRKRDAWKYGSLETKALDNGAVFGFSRIYDGAGFLVLANFADFEVTLNAMVEFEGIPETATVYSRSLGFLPESTHVGDVIRTDSIVIGGKHSFIVEF